MAIEVIGPRAAGKTTLLKTLPPAVVPIKEPLFELNAAGLLHAEPGLTRQKAVIDHVLAQSVQAGDWSATDSGVIYLLAFSHLHFGMEPALTDLFEVSAAVCKAPDIRCSGILRLNAPDRVLAQRRLADPSRKRGHFHENLVTFGAISSLIDDLVYELGRDFLFSVDNTDDTNQLNAARQWIQNRTRRIPLHDVVLTANSVWRSHSALPNQPL